MKEKSNCLEKKGPKMKNLHVRVWCMGCYDSTIPVPDDMDKEAAFAYAKEHLDEVPLTSIEYLPDSDELDDADLDNGLHTYFEEKEV